MARRNVFSTTTTRRPTAADASQRPDLAALTGLSFAELSTRYRQRAGESVYVHAAFSRRWLSRVAGLGIVCAGVISSAAISNGFAGYFGQALPSPDWLAVTLVILLLGAVAAWGIGESATIAAMPRTQRPPRATRAQKPRSATRRTAPRLTTRRQLGRRMPCPYQPEPGPSGSLTWVSFLPLSRCVTGYTAGVRFRAFWY